MASFPIFPQIHPTGCSYACKSVTRAIPTDQSPSAPLSHFFTKVATPREAAIPSALAPLGKSPPCGRHARQSSLRRGRRSKCRPLRESLPCIAARHTLLSARDSLCNALGDDRADADFPAGGLSPADSLDGRLCRHRVPQVARHSSVNLHLVHRCFLRRDYLLRDGDDGGDASCHPLPGTLDSAFRSHGEPRPSQVSTPELPLAAALLKAHGEHRKKAQHRPCRQLSQTFSQHVYELLFSSAQRLAWRQTVRWERSSQLSPGSSPHACGLLFSSQLQDSLRRVFDSSQVILPWYR